MRLVIPSTLIGSAALSGAHVDEAFHPGCRSRRQQVAGAEHVGLYRLVRIALEERDVLQGGGVKDQLRSVFSEHLFDSLAIADVGHHQGFIVEQGSSLEAELEPVQGVFVAIEQQQALGSELLHHEGEFGAMGR
jgi:hypothetical protein